MLKEAGRADDDRDVLARYRISFAVVLLAVASTGAFFSFFRPEYRAPGNGKAILPPSYVSPASRGWVWPHGLPGYRFGHDEDRWNFAKLAWSDLAPLRIAARRQGIDPQSLRVLDGERLSFRGRPFLLVAGRDARGETCFGAQPGEGAVAFVCAPRLRHDVAFLMAVPRPGGSFFVDGVVSGAVKHVTISVTGLQQVVVRGATRVSRPAGVQVLYDAADNHSWGLVNSYRADETGWNGDLAFYGAHGMRLASLDLHYTHPGAYVYCASALTARCGSSTQRRS